MATFFNKGMVGYGRFAGLLLGLGAGACKSEAASKQPDLMLEKQNQKYASTFSTVGSTEADQKDKVIPIPAKGNSEGAKNDSVQVKANHPHKNLKDHPETTDQVDAPPSFTFPEKITIQAGMQQSITLAAAGHTAGYSINSISVKQNGRYCTGQFRVKHLETKPVPPSGLPITLTTDPTLQAGPYLLRITIGKTGKGSGKTKQLVASTIDVIKNEVKNDKQNNEAYTYGINQKTQPLNSSEISQNDCASQDATDSPESIQAPLAQNYTTPIEPIFTLQDVTIQKGTQQSIMLEATGITDEYVIKTISVSQNKSYHTKKFGIDLLKNKSIPSSGLPMTLTTDSKLKAGQYQLKIKIGKTGAGSRKTEQWVKYMIHVIENESKK